MVPVVPRPSGRSDHRSSWDPEFQAQYIKTHVDPEYCESYVERLICGVPEESRRREVTSLSLLLKEVWDARQAGTSIHPRDDGRNWGSKVKHLGFVIGNEWVLCQVTGTRGQEPIDPQVASLFGLTPEEAKIAMHDYKLRQWLAGWFPEVTTKTEEQPS